MITAHLIILGNQFHETYNSVLTDANSRKHLVSIVGRFSLLTHLWQERFHSFPMDENYLLATVRYVELNPVTANMCSQPQDWIWSSASAHLAGCDDILVKVKPMLDRVGNWQQYLLNDDSSSNDLVAQHKRTGRPLGSDSFVKKLETFVVNH